ncbi:cysteine desulfurase/selenocysteine lyase [Methylohalomonas lacus]|uniref:Cysteine desulfurase n=1 Tax=Methylohalomonas lacus TaxID=398773 RepID=A0AAE3HHU3_9GAMM|nr:cysteine desulfurase [Methylohalomonas lacus]MCS3902135.1 cysteine desulfurase/selenocysteine lyase [Methylohalomonas lacus]
MNQPVDSTAAELLGGNRPALDVERVRADFPILHQEVRGKPLAYFDNAATSQKPAKVIETVDHYYRALNSNIHRGVHYLSEQATSAYENAREAQRRFINAESTREIVFVRGATEAINLIVQSWGRSQLKAGDEVIISEMEHHSNIVPWQMLRDQIGIELKVIPINDAGELQLDIYEELLNERTKLVAINHLSNALGTVNPVKSIIDQAHEAGALVLVDGAQAVPHTPVDVQALGCDFYVYSGHKLFGPTGIGVLYGREDLLEAMPPYQGGGDMIKMVKLDRTIYNDLPYKFEAGTPHIAGGIGLGAAVEYVEDIGLEAIAAYEHDLLEYATEQALTVEGLKLIGTAQNKASILSFIMDGVHPHDLGTIVDSEGIAIRTGHHCAMPVMDHFGVPATARASFAFYNTHAEIDRLIAALKHAHEVLA